MKKILARVLLGLLMVAMIATAVACTNDPADPAEPDPVTTPSTDPGETDPDDGNKEDIHAKSEGVMTYAEYEAAALDSEVVIEAFVQGKQSWWENKGTFYTQDKDGAYFLYELACTEEQYNQLTVGTKIKVTGYKAEWSGEVEIVDATFEILEGNWVAEATDMTALLGKDELIKHQNMVAVFKGMTVVSVSYKNDQRGDDIYVTLSKDGAEYSFCVEYYLTNTETAVYQAVEALKAGDVIDVTGFLYWYNGPNTHITAIAPAAE